MCIVHSAQAERIWWIWLRIKVSWRRTDKRAMSNYLPLTSLYCYPSPIAAWWRRQQTTNGTNTLCTSEQQVFRAGKNCANMRCKMRWLIQQPASQPKMTAPNSTFNKMQNMHCFRTFALISAIKYPQTNQPSNNINEKNYFQLLLPMLTHAHYTLHRKSRYLLIFFLSSIHFFFCEMPTFVMNVAGVAGLRNACIEPGIRCILHLVMLEYC